MAEQDTHDGLGRPGNGPPGRAEKAGRLIHRRLDRVESQLPGGASRWLAWLRRPETRWVRLPAGFLLIVGGLVGFLPVLGFWMVPVGLLLLSLDIPFLRVPAAWLILKGEQAWRGLRRRFSGKA